MLAEKMFFLRSIASGRETKQGRTAVVIREPTPRLAKRLFRRVLSLALGTESASRVLPPQVAERSGTAPPRPGRNPARTPLHILRGLVFQKTSIDFFSGDSDSIYFRGLETGKRQKNLCAVVDQTVFTIQLSILNRMSFLEDFLDMGDRPGVSCVQLVGA